MPLGRIDHSTPKSRHLAAPIASQSYPLNTKVLTASTPQNRTIIHILGTYHYSQPHQLLGQHASVNTITAKAGSTDEAQHRLGEVGTTLSEYHIEPQRPGRHDANPQRPRRCPPSKIPLNTMSSHKGQDDTSHTPHSPAKAGTTPTVHDVVPRRSGHRRPCTAPYREGADHAQHRPTKVGTVSTSHNAIPQSLR